MSILSELNKQNSLDDAICLADITNEEQLKELQSKGYLVEYTRQTWEKTYPSIPATNIYCFPSRVVPADLMYMDFEHYIFFHTRIYGEQFLTVNGEAFLAAAQKQIEWGMKRYHNKDYLKLLYPVASENSGNLVMDILQRILQREKKSAKLYQAFFQMYTFSDYGASRLSHETMQKLVACKSPKQKEATRKAVNELPDEITIYRGEGSKSTPYTKAYSWTTDINIAYFFAGRAGGEKARIISAKLLKENVLEYITDRKESEILAMPEHVYDVAIDNLTTLDWFLRVITSSLPGFTETALKPHMALGLKERSEKLYLQKNGHEGYHDCLHTCRVAFFASFLYRTLFLVDNVYKQSKTALLKQYGQLMDAAIFHDIDRADDSANATHGIAGYQVYLQYHEPDPVVQFLIENHCVDDEIALKHLEESDLPNKPVVKALFEILKDADALDRWRFGCLGADTLNIQMLRLKEAKKLASVAATIQNMHF